MTEGIIAEELESMQSATLVLEDGTCLVGEAFGARADAVFELVFNTSMTGYQEILSDPSYRGQGVLFTASQVGNTGINCEDNEAAEPQVSAVVLRELSPLVSNWRASTSLAEWLAARGIPGISGVDTRWLARKLRSQGTLKAALSTCGTPAADLLRQAREWPGLDGRDMVGEASSSSLGRWVGDAGSQWVAAGLPASELHLVVYDFGAKQNILRHLAAGGAQIWTVPAYTPASEVLALHPDGIIFSNGPGDPAGLPGITAEVGRLIESGLPILGICLGHQLIGRAIGGQTERLKFGHHSGNHPVKDLSSGRVMVTAQNHNYAVRASSLDPEKVEVTHLSLNDGTLEGLRLRQRPVFSVQFHPEGAPGPHDAHRLFGQFFKLIRQHRLEEAQHA
jgi:carbamoyl-phosphate synthase small subunit